MTANYCMKCEDKSVSIIFIYIASDSYSISTNLAAPPSRNTAGICIRMLAKNFLPNVPTAHQVSSNRSFDAMQRWEPRHTKQWMLFDQVKPSELKMYE